MIYKAVIKDSNGGAPPPTPHPYEVALGVFCLHKVLLYFINNHLMFLFPLVCIRELC